MNNKYGTKLLAAVGFSLAAGVAQAAVQDVVVNGDFETGDTSGWLEFDLGGTISVVSDNGPSGPGSSAGLLSANAENGASFPILKVERLAEGLLTNGAPVTIKFDAKSTLQTHNINNGNFDGKVVFIAEFFTELTGDNGAINQILIEPPTFLSTEWQTFEFNTTLGADAGGGLSMLFKADCGGNPTCRFDALIDNLSITTEVSQVPVPAAAWLFGSALMGLVGMSRRRKS